MRTRATPRFWGGGGALSSQTYMRPLGRGRALGKAAMKRYRQSAKGPGREQDRPKKVARIAQRKGCPPGATGAQQGTPEGLSRIPQGRARLAIPHGRIRHAGQTKQSGSCCQGHRRSARSWPGDWTIATLVHRCRSSEPACLGPAKRTPISASWRRCNSTVQRYPAPTPATG